MNITINGIITNDPIIEKIRLPYHDQVNFKLRTYENGRNKTYNCEMYLTYENAKRFCEVYKKGEKIIVEGRNISDRKTFAITKIKESKIGINNYDRKN